MPLSPINVLLKKVIIDRSDDTYLTPVFGTDSDFSDIGGEIKNWKNPLVI